MTTGKDIVDKARTVIGYPYIFGGSSPSQGGFDCSGLVQYIYKQFGINLPRTTYDLINVGKKITSQKDLVEGDLIFYLDNNGSPYHVMIYSGKGKVIEARYEGTKVNEYSYYRWEGVAVRIIDNNISKPIDDNDLIMYRVICGSYKDIKNANIQKDNLQQIGIYSFIAIYKEITTLYRVIAGSYKTLENAQARQQFLESKGFKSFILTYKGNK